MKLNGGGKDRFVDEVKLALEKRLDEKIFKVEGAELTDARPKAPARGWGDKLIAGDQISVVVAQRFYASVSRSSTFSVMPLLANHFVNIYAHKENEVI